MTAPLDAALRSGLQALGLPLQGAQVAQLLDFLELLQKWNKVYNLTAVRDPQHMLTHHLLDSLAAVAPLQRHLAQTCANGAAGSAPSLGGGRVEERPAAPQAGALPGSAAAGAVWQETVAPVVPFFGVNVRVAATVPDTVVGKELAVQRDQEIEGIKLSSLLEIAATSPPIALFASARHAESADFWV